MGGKRKLKLPARDRLFAMTTAQVTLETSLGLRHRNVAGIAFQSLATADFKEIVSDTKELLTGAASDTGTKVETSTDEYGYAWIILRDPDFEDLVVSINTVSSSLEGGGYGDRLLAAVFAVGEGGRRPYFSYNFKVGLCFPLVPAAGVRQRNTERELKLKAQIGAELPL